MRVTDTAFALLAAVSAADAQLNWDKIYQVKPSLKAVTTTAASATTNRASIASSIYSSKSSVLAVISPITTSTTKSSTKSSTKAASSTTKTTLASSVKASSTSTLKTSTKSTTSSAKTSAKTSSVSKAKRDDLEKRAATTTSSSLPACTSNSYLYGYVPSNNTGYGFINDQFLNNTALAQYVPPAGFSTNFTALYGEVTGGPYLGYYQLSAYDPTACAAYCTARSDCQAVGIYYEYDPSYNYNSNCAYNQTAPPGNTSIGCTLWGSAVNPSMATNYGQYQGQFIVFVQGSNGYNRNTPPAAFNNFTQAPLKGAVDVTAINGAIVLTSSSFFATYDPSQCGYLCTNLTATNRAAAIKNGATSYTPCNYFNTFYLDLAGAHQGMYCQLYTTATVAPYADLYATTQNGVAYNVSYSYGYTANYTDVGLVTPPAVTPTSGSCAAIETAATYNKTAGDGTGNLGLFRDINTQNYTVGCGYDLTYLGDIGNHSAGSFAECFNNCDNFYGCNAFSWLNSVCYYKNIATVLAAPSVPAFSVDLAWLPASFTPLATPKTLSSSTAWPTTTIYSGSNAVTTYTTIINGTGYTAVVSSNSVYGFTSSSGTYYTTTVTTGGGYTGTAVASSTTIGTTNVQGARYTTATVAITYPTPAITCNNVGINYAFYSNLFAGYQSTTSYPKYTPEAFKTITPKATGTATYLGESGAPSVTATIYGVKTLQDTLTIDQTFYLYAHQTGYYTMVLPTTDDITLVWVGSKALLGWNRANADLINTSIGGKVAYTSFFFTVGESIPIRVQWGNGLGNGLEAFTMYAPDGAILMQNNGANGGTAGPQIITAPCATASGSPFPAWGNEL